MFHPSPLSNTKVTDDTKNFIQEKFQCCGFKNPSDNPGSKCPIIPNITGCYQKVIDYQKNELQKVYISFFVLLLVEGLCVVSALALCRKK
ncbi:hypothetical protein BKA69DRAFT_1044102 [Paraphysoderma sedebokerense]|nr:hypothetical protein BKA69DRAFT_1044102 [Paraphysoderma sedebokerense]